jgi:acetyl esterase
MGRTLDPQVETLIEQVDAERFPRQHYVSVTAARAWLEEMNTTENPESVDDVIEFSIPAADHELRLRVYYPEGEPPFPSLVFFHGGGWVIGSLDTHDDICRGIANSAGCAVVSVDYRLAPEFPFPAAAEDCYLATEWVAEAGGDIDIDTDRIAVGGTSAGGNLAAVVSLMARNRGGPEIAHQSLMYPVTNDPKQRQLESYEQNAEGYFLETEMLPWYYNRYLPREIDRRNVCAFPLQADDLSDLPPAKVITCEFDPLRDDGRLYAERLSEDGVDVEYTNYDGMIHAFLGLIHEVDRARDGIDDVATSLKNAW